MSGFAVLVAMSSAVVGAALGGCIAGEGLSWRVRIRDLFLLVALSAMSLAAIVAFLKAPSEFGTADSLRYRRMLGAFVWVTLLVWVGLLLYHVGRALRRLRSGASSEQ